MMKTLTTAGGLCAIIALAGCNTAEEEQGLTRAEERELDEAAAQLDAAQEEYEAALQESEPQNGDETAE